jgi:hypothetical protein
MKNVFTLSFDLAVAVVSLSILAATPTWLANREIGILQAVFLCVASILGLMIALFRFQDDRDTAPIQLFARAATPLEKHKRITIQDSLRAMDWIGRARRT